MLNNYFGIIKSSFKKGFVYKIDNLLSIVNRIIEVSVLIFIWKAIYGGTVSINGMNLETLIVYYAVAYSLNHIMTWGINEYIASSIKNGRINMELLYPIDYMKYFFCYKFIFSFYQYLIFRFNHIFINHHNLFYRVDFWINDILYNIRLGITSSKKITHYNTIRCNCSVRIFSNHYSKDNEYSSFH